MVIMFMMMIIIITKVIKMVIKNTRDKEKEIKKLVKIKK